MLREKIELRPNVRPRGGEEEAINLFTKHLHSQRIADEGGGESLSVHLTAGPLQVLLLPLLHVT